MMLEALAADAARDPAIEVTVLLEAGRRIDLPAGVRLREVAGDDAAALVDAARSADCTLIVAPETDGILADRVGRVRCIGGRVPAPSAEFLAIAADKQATIDCLAAAGLPVPAGRALAAGEPLPENFRRPGVLKARDGAGGEGLRLLSTAGGPEEPLVADGNSRLEAYAAGMSVGISCICSAAATRVLPPLVQRPTESAPDSVVGDPCEPLADRAAAERACVLANRAVAALTRAGGPAVGWVGVDIILGTRHDGRDDRVLEINPRLTTSFVVQSRLASRSLVRSLLDSAACP